MSLLQVLNLKAPAHLAPPASGTKRAPTAAPGGVAAAGRAKPPAPKLSANNYIALINGINFLVTHWQQPGTLNVAPSDEKDLMPQHRGLLLTFRSALITMKTAPAEALALWEKISPDLTAEIRRSASAGVESADVAATTAQLVYAKDKLFVPAAYWAAQREAKGNSDLEAPDTAQMAPKLARAEAELGEAKELFEQSVKIASGIGKMSGTEAPKEVKEIIELVMLPGSIDDKLAYARKHGIAGTAVELVGKVTGATGTILKHVGEVGEKVVEARKALVLARGATKAAKETAEQLEKVAGKFKKLANAAKTIGKAASYAAVIADGFKLVSALRDGDYEEALKVTGELIGDAAPLVFGEEIAGPLAVVTVTVKAELEVFRLAAAFIRWCKDETVREAAASFIEQCDVIAKGAAFDLVANCTLLIDPSKASLHEAAFKKANRQAALVSKGIKALASHVTATEKHAIGAYPGVVRSLGKPALQAMTVVFDENDGVLLVAQQVADVFHGANSMAKYVKETYTN